MRITISPSDGEHAPTYVADLGSEESTGEAVDAVLGLLELHGHHRSNINRRAMERVGEALD